MQNTSSEWDTPMLIVGGGVVGLTASLFLDQAGVRSTLVERHSGTSIYPRARGVNGRTMELLRSVGLEERVKEAGSRLAPAVGIHSGKTLVEVLDRVGSGGFLMRRVRARGLRGQSSKTSPNSACRCTQEDLEPILLEEAKRRGVAAHFSTECIRFEQDSRGVTATLLDRKTREERTVRAGYVIAADGARSRVREQLGIPVSGNDLAGHQLNVYFKADLRELVRDREFSLCLVENPEVRALVTSIDNACLWVMHVSYHPDRGETPEQFTAERCADLVRAAVGLPALEVTIKQISPWQSAVRVASAYVKGRVFLAGDSAHTMPPWGGFGANTGIQDGHNLAWKLGLVLSGAASEKLLDTYQVERLPVARAVSQISGELSDERGLIRVGSLLSTLWRMRRVFPYLGMGYGYSSSAVAVEPGGSPGPGTRDLKGRPGTRAPHLWLEKDGVALSTLDLMGKTFVLLTADPGASWRAAAETVSSALGVPIQAITIGPHLREPKGKWLGAYGLKDTGASLVRPDGIVAWRSPRAHAEPARELERVMRRLLAR